MCLIVFAYDQHSQYRLILAANRDEAYGRPTKPAQFWEEQSDLLAGKDLQSGGTWLGITRAGAFSAVTNFRDPTLNKENPPSRGHLVLDFLKQNNKPEDYLHRIAQKGGQYMGFNLLVGTPDQLGYYSNQPDEVTLLNPGLYGISNHLLDTPWPKIERGKKLLHQQLENGTVSEEALFRLLADDTPAPDEKLPSTGIPLEIERKVSPIFITGEEYGTRCSTVLLIDREGIVTFTERRLTAGTKEIAGENSYSFKLS